MIVNSTSCTKQNTIVMSEHFVAWIRQAATLSDTALEEELNLINKNSINASARVSGEIRRPEVDSHSKYSGLRKSQRNKIK